MTVKLRYKQPDADTSQLISIPVANSKTKAPRHIGFASAVAEFGMLLRNSEHRGSSSYNGLLRRARAAVGSDPRGYRSEFIRLIEAAAGLCASGESSTVLGSGVLGSIFSAALCYTPAYAQPDTPGGRR